MPDEVSNTQIAEWVAMYMPTNYRRLEDRYADQLIMMNRYDQRLEAAIIPEINVFDVESCRERTDMSLGTLTKSRKPKPLVVTNREGKEFEPVEGMLVMHSTGCCNNTLSRLVRVNPGASIRTHTAILRPIHSRDDHTVYLRDVTLISTELVDNTEEGKDPPLLDRIENFHKNMYRAIQRLGNGSDRRDLDLLNRLYRIVTLYDVPREHRWFWSTMAESQDDPRKISYATSIEASDNNRNRRKCGISRFLKSKSKDYGFEFSPADSERIGYLIGVHFPRCYDYKFDIVTGIEIYRGYRDSQESWNSCMKGRPYVKWYSANPESVSLVKVMLGDIYEGRALLWNTDQGVKVLDRVYPSDNGPQTLALHNLCEQNGWDYKTTQGPEDGNMKSKRRDYTVKMKNTRTLEWSKTTGYPYMDSFKYTKNRPDRDSTLVLGLSSTAARARFISTSGTYENCGRESSEDYEYHCSGCQLGLYDENTWMSPNDEIYCESCFDSRWIYLRYIIGNEYIEGTYEIVDVVDCWGCGSQRLTEHMTTIDSTYFCSDCSRKALTHRSTQADTSVTDSGLTLV